MRRAIATAEASSMGSTIQPRTGILRRMVDFA
jgi:hypothetical protein